MRLAQLIQEQEARGEFAAVVTNANAQFGTAARPFIGATLLPERIVPSNTYRERSIRFRSIIAAVISRYSPPPIENSASIGDFLVEMGTIGRKDNIQADQLDTLMALVGRNLTTEGAQALMNFSVTSLLMPVMIRNEAQRWQAITDAFLMRVGEHGAQVPVRYTNPAGHRVQLADLWNDPSADAPADFFAMVDLMRGEGTAIRTVYASTRMINRFLLNAETQKLVGSTVFVNGSNLNVTPQRATLGRLNEYLAAEGLPSLTRNDQTYQTVTGTARFMRDDAMVFIGDTGEDVDLAGGTETAAGLLPSTLGYFAVGRVGGRPAPGRHILVRAFEDHPIRVEGEIVEEGLPVITQPTAIGVLSETAFPS